MKKITLSLLLCLICLSGMAQSSKKLDLKDITSGKYRAENIRNVVPMPDGEHYTQMNEEGTQITKYSFKTGEPVEVIFDVTKARECDFKNFDGYQFSPDGEKLLIATEITPIYRRSYTAVHYLYPLKRNEKGVTTNNIIERLSDGGPQQAPVFSPDGTMIASYATIISSWIKPFMEQRKPSDGRRQTQCSAQRYSRLGIRRGVRL